MTQITADLLLLAVTLVWGSTFVLVKNAIEKMGPLTFIAVRFLVAGGVLLLWHFARTAFGRPQCSSKSPVSSGSTSARGFYFGAIVTGLALFFSYATQTLGLVTVAAGKAAFITGLYVVIVPVVSRLLLRTSPDRNVVVGVILATVGLGLMSVKLPFELAFGDLLVLMCAVGFGAHILLVGHYSGRGDPVLFAAIQLLVVSAGSFAYAFAFERPIAIAPDAWGAIIFTAIAATAFAFLAQTAVQRYTTATHTALIFAAEPVFGALFAYLLIGETLSPKEFAGAALILAGMLVSEARALRSLRSAEQAS